MIEVEMLRQRLVERDAEIREMVLERNVQEAKVAEEKSFKQLVVEVHSTIYDRGVKYKLPMPNSRSLDRINYDQSRIVWKRRR